VDFSLLSQHVACFWVLQQPAVSVVEIVSLGLSEPGKRNSLVVIGNSSDLVDAGTTTYEADAKRTHFPAGLANVQNRSTAAEG
jgi:hypothetical protein